MIRDGQTRARVGAQSPAARLYALEQEDARLSARLHRDTTRRALIQDEMRALRARFGGDDDRAYRRLVFVREGLRGGR